MAAIVMDGKAVARKVREEVSKEISECMEESKIYCRIPKLSIIMVGNNPASETYVRNKTRAAREVGIETEVIRLTEEEAEHTIYSHIDLQCDDKSVDGVMVQMPLPPNLDAKEVMEFIDPHKDVDGFHIKNVGRVVRGDPDCFAPCTPGGVMRLLREYQIDAAGKHAVVVGRSDIVGKPMAAMLLNANATVTVCHSRTENLKDFTRQADILIVAAGKPKLITADMVKPGAVVIDVGFNHLEDGTLCGDVDFESVKEVAGYITPVPGGVGPMTVAMLMANTAKAYLRPDF